MYSKYAWFVPLKGNVITIAKAIEKVKMILMVNQTKYW